jgi:5'-nucleotidase
MHRTTLRTLISLVVVSLAVASGCSSGDATTAASTTTASSATEPTSTAEQGTAAPTTAAPTTAASTTAAPTTAAASTTVDNEPLTILVTNDDGIGAAGIDAVVAALQSLPDVNIVVVAPADNQSGSSDKTTDGTLVATESATVSGFVGTAVDGFPADSVNYALDVLGIEPDVVVSGANATQNIGIFVPISGTVGAARTAARRGIPAIAVSAGGLENQDFTTSASFAAAEVERLRDRLGFGNNTDQTVININTPTCAPGTAVRGIVDVAVAAEFPAGTNGLDLVFDCASTDTDPTDDAQALVIGFASRSIVPADL